MLQACVSDRRAALIERASHRLSDFEKKIWIFGKGSLYPTVLLVAPDHSVEYSTRAAILSPTLPYINEVPGTLMQYFSIRV
jgi:hypothetical protein